MKQTNWKEEFDKEFNHLIKWERFPEEVSSIKDFISNLIEQVINELPTDDDLNDMDYPWQGINKLKQQLKDKYL